MRNICKSFFLLCVILLSACCGHGGLQSEMNGNWRVAAYDEDGRYQTIEEFSADKYDYPDLPVPMWHFQGLTLELNNGTGRIFVKENGNTVELKDVGIKYKIDKYDNMVRFVLTRQYGDTMENLVYEGYIDEKTGQLIIEFSPREDISSAIYLSRI